VLDEAFARGAVTFPSPGVVPPVVLRQVKPTYTAEAMRRKISGTVELRVRIGADGLVEDVRVVSSLDRTSGLDREAARVARLWLFKPATAGPQAVASIVDITIAFQLG
jgi:TonB family protein